MPNLQTGSQCGNALETDRQNSYLNFCYTCGSVYLAHGDDNDGATLYLFFYAGKSKGQIE